MLAHRGWDVYLLPRVGDDGKEVRGNRADGWAVAVEAAAGVARDLGDKLIVFGADVGASIALAALASVRPLALALFAPVAPATIGRAVSNSMGFFERRRARGGGFSSPPAELAKQAHRETDASPEPSRFVEELGAGVAFTPPAEHPPAIVFLPQADPLVAREDALAFTQSPYAKVAKTAIKGRWWPSSNWDPVADEVHRFLILTLADRVVEFPDEILES